MKKIFSLIVFIIVFIAIRSCVVTKNIKPIIYVDDIEQRISKMNNYSLVITIDYDTLLMNSGYHLRQGIPNTQLSGIFQRYKDGNLVFQTSVIKGRFTGIYELFSIVSFKLKERGVFLNGRVIKRIVFNEEGDVISTEESDNIMKSLVKFR